MSALDAVAAELDGGMLEQHTPVDLDGVPVHATLSPPDGEALSAAIGALSRAGLAAVPRGAGRHLSLGNPPTRADVFLSTLRIEGIEVFEPAEGVCRVKAGTRLAAVHEQAEKAGWELPLDAPEEATVGGALAAASVGPRSHAFGPARDAVLGLDVVLGSGERTRCGGRVVKNVTGYDLAKLYTGSVGSLAVIEAAWLRLRPRPETSRVLSLLLAPEEACEASLAAARRVSVRACALHVTAKDLELVVELAGDEAAVAADAETLGGEAADAARLDTLAALQWGEPGEPRPRHRIAYLPSELAAVLAPLRSAGLEALVYPGLGLAYVFGRNAGSSRDAVAASARAASGPLRCESAPRAEKARGDVFGATAPERRLFSALKQRFDPQGVLSPGRLVS